jgi:superoxide dismutase, Fe-Mn family
MTEEKKLEPLPYAYDALEPFIDKETMMIHHDKHHQTYFDKYTAAIKGKKDLEKKTVFEVLKNLNAVPEELRTAVRNHGGGYANHLFFWPLLKKNTPLQGTIADQIHTTFGGFEQFKEAFSTAALAQFGSGWTWLVWNNEKLEIMNTPNQDSPLSAGKIPLLCIDVWEHAYYLKYHNRRADYVQAFFSIINWEKVNAHLEGTKKKK